MQEHTQNIELHDFNDGAGLVPARRHINGNGWVANTARVDDTAYIGRNAKIFDYAVIRDNAVIDEEAEISGYAVIRDNAHVKGKAVIRGTAVLKDNAEISGQVFIARHMSIGKDQKLQGRQCFFDATDCLVCPALMDENYSACHANPCVYCMEKFESYKESKSSENALSLSSIWSWLPQGRTVNQNENSKAH